MNTAILKTTILSVICMDVVTLLAGIVCCSGNNRYASHMRYLLPIPLIGVASCVFVYNLFSYYGGTRPGPCADIAKGIVWASAISSVSFFVFTLILVFLVDLLKDIEPISPCLPTTGHDGIYRTDQSRLQGKGH